jgi:hypothetical protein
VGSGIEDGGMLGRGGYSNIEERGSNCMVCTEGRSPKESITPILNVTRASVLVFLVDVYNCSAL